MLRAGTPTILPMIRQALAAVTLALSLSACAATDASSGSESGKPETASYSTVEELMDAAIDAGYNCPQRKVEDFSLANENAGSCSDNDRFLAGLSEDDVQMLLKESGKNTYLVGPDWFINSPKAKSLQKNLGGKFYDKT